MGRRPRARSSGACRPCSGCAISRARRMWPTLWGWPRPGWPERRARYRPAGCLSGPADDGRGRRERESVAGGPGGMIAALRGRLRRKLEDRVVLEAAGVGYEVYLPPVTQQALGRARAADDDGADAIALSLHFHATQNQPRPVLIGFTSELDRECFEKLITVKDVGPLVAARSLAVPVGEIAAAIAREDEAYLRRLPGIGAQKAKNIVAQLQGKVAKFALAHHEGASPDKPAVAAPARGEDDGSRNLVFEVLVKQLGHRPSEAAQLITAAFARRPGIATPEELFDEIYRGASRG